MYKETVKGLKIQPLLQNDIFIGLDDIILTSSAPDNVCMLTNAKPLERPV